jgi:hypothetical protein
MTTGTFDTDSSSLDALREGRTSAEFWLPRVLALAASVVSPLALVLDLRWGMPMSSIGLILWLASILLAIASVTLARRTGDESLLRIAVAAVLAGYMATATYDASRVAGLSAGVVEMDEALDFGMRLSGQVQPGAGHTSMHTGGPSAEHERGSAMEHGTMEDGHAAEHMQTATPSLGRGATVALGYAWHYWSGIMFSLAFLVLFGARGWKWAVPYLLFVIYPGMVFAMGSHTVANFIWEAVGHAGFGVTLGIVSSALLYRSLEHQSV